MISFEAIVESHVKSRVTTDPLNEKTDRENPSKIEPHFFSPAITFSNTYGSKAKWIVAKVAETLGYQVYDKALLEAISQSTSVQSRIMEALNEGDRQRVLSFIQQTSAPYYVNDESYLKALVQTVRSLSLLGNTIFMGRGTCHILRDLEAFNVRIVASLEDRVQWIMDKKNMNRDEALEDLQAKDQRKTSFIKRYFDLNVNDPESYSLVLNTSYIPPNLAEQVIVSVYNVTKGMGEHTMSAS